MMEREHGTFSQIGGMVWCMVFIQKAHSVKFQQPTPKGVG